MILCTRVSAEGSRPWVDTYAGGMVKAEGVLLVILVAIAGELACRVVVWWKKEKKAKEL